LAQAVERLISHGHNNPYKYTPKQAAGYCELAQNRRSEDLANMFIITQNAMHADEKGAKKLMKELTSGTV